MCSFWCMGIGEATPSSHNYAVVNNVWFFLTYYSYLDNTASTPVNMAAMTLSERLLPSV